MERSGCERSCHGEDFLLFKFLSELSPIQPAKSVHHAETYNDLTFPQEHRLLASLRSATRRSSTSSLKRCVAAERLSAQAKAEGRQRQSTSSLMSHVIDCVMP